MALNTFLPSFTDLLKKFTKDLHETYGNKYPELEPLRHSIIMFANTFPETCARMFHSQVTVPYASYIESKDQEFFVSTEFLDTVMTNVSTNQSYLDTMIKTKGNENNIMDMMKLIRTIWVDMTDDNRKHVWDYMTGLVFLSKRMFDRSSKSPV